MSNLSIKSILEKHILTGPDFLDWIRNVRLVLRQEKVEYVLDTPIPVRPTNVVKLAKFDEAHLQKHVDDACNIQSVMLASMSMELQRQHEKMMPFEMLDHLKSLFDSQSKSLKFDLLRKLLRCRLQEGGNVSDHVLKMIVLIEKLATVGINFESHVSVIFILQSLPDSYSTFIVNYNMNAKEVTLPELHNMLKTYGQTISKWKRDCEKAKAAGDQMHGVSGSNKGIFVVEINMSTSNSDCWVLDTTCGSHICNNVEGLIDSRPVRPGEIELRIGNGARVAAERVGTYKLDLPT